MKNGVESKLATSEIIQKRKMIKPQECNLHFVSHIVLSHYEGIVCCLSK